MKRVISLLVCIVCVVLLSACSSPSVSDDGILKIVVTAFPHYDFARQLTKNIDNVEIKMLISPGSEVHTYEPTPSDILAISECDLLICTGGESDTWIDGIVESSGNKQMQIISFMDICYISKHQDHDGHEHEYDEHVWTSPSNVLFIATHMTEALCDKDKENAGKIRENYEFFLGKTNEIINEFEDIAKSRIRDEIIVADRFPFYHLANEVGFEYSAAYPGCSSSTEPSAAVIAELSDKVKREKIPYVFTIEFSNQKIAKNVISGTDAKILTLHSCHTVTAEEFESGITYYDLMKQNAQNLRKALCE